MSRRGRLSVEEYVNGILAGDRVILSRAITLIESSLEDDTVLAAQVMEQVLPHTGNSIRIGITGVPGVGKSTFIEAFGELAIQKGKKIAVLAIDPSSQKTGGSILGDKTRMDILSVNPKAYIRPTPAGNKLGGVANKTRETMLFCEAAGFDIVVIETVGVGQSETAVKDMTDFFLLLMLAGAGDELQGIKKGIMEMADALIINKADGDNLQKAKNASIEYQNALHLFPASYPFWYPRVGVCSSIQNEGIENIWDIIFEFVTLSKKDNFFEGNRKSQNVKWFYNSIDTVLKQRFYADNEIQNALEEVNTKIAEGNFSPSALAKKMVDAFLKREK